MHWISTLGVVGGDGVSEPGSHQTHAALPAGGVRLQLRVLQLRGEEGVVLEDLSERHAHEGHVAEDELPRHVVCEGPFGEKTCISISSNFVCHQFCDCIKIIESEKE